MKTPEPMDVVHVIIAMAIGSACIYALSTLLPAGVRPPVVLFMAFLPGIVYLQFVGVHHDFPEDWSADDADL